MNAKKALELFSLLPRYRFTLNVNLIYTYHLIEQGENMHILSSYHFLLLKGTNAFLPRYCLPPVVPNFTGRQTECEEITRHVTAQSSRMVSIWGSPGFGKTSVAIAVGHKLQSQGLPVCWITLRGLQSKADLTSKLLSFVRQAVSHHQSSSQRLSLDDELCQLFSEISDRFVFILDNADDLLESGFPNVKEEVIGLLEEILRRNEKIKFIVTTRESLEFMKLHFQCHHGVRIRPLDETSSQSLVNELLPNASNSDVRQIIQICGHVPLAIKLLCSSISDEDSQFLRDVIESSTEGIFEMLDNPDYPTSHRLKFLFNSSFQRLSTQEKEALVCLCILPENFDVNIAAAVLNKTGILCKKILQSLRRKSLIDSSSKPSLFTMHKLLQSFAREKGEHEMKETVDNSKGRFYAYYVSCFKELNEQFLKGHSMSAFVAFYEEKESFIESLIESCSDSRTADDVFDVLVEAELFLDSVFWCSSEVANFDKIYDSALKGASVHRKNMCQTRLIASRAFARLTWGAEGMTMQFLSKVNEIREETSPVPTDVKGKYTCYFGIYQLVIGKTEGGVQCLQEALSLLNNNNPEQTILRLIVFQILALYCQFQNNPLTSSQFYSKALQECRTARATNLLVIPGTEMRTMQTHGKRTLLNKPLELQVIYHVTKASEQFSHLDTDKFLWNALLTTIKEVTRALSNGTPGLFYFHQNAVSMLGHFKTQKLAEELIRHLEECKKRFGEEHSSIADSYRELGITQHELGDFNSALESQQRALEIRRKLFGEEHSTTADSYRELGITQHNLGDFNSALESHQRALGIQRELFGEEHSSTADSYRELGITQHNLGDFNSALESHQRALGIRRELFGDEHSSTADSYRELGITQHKLGDFNSALESKQRALDIQRKLFGEEHSSTADSYRALGITQHELGDFNSALESKQRALDIRRKLFGEEHSSTADSYRELGITQHELGDFNSALESQQRALDIRRKLFGEEHSSTADSYRELGITQHKLGDFNSALESTQRALDIQRKLFGEEHSSTADSYRELGITQHKLGDFNSALESDQRALDIRRKLFGEEHSSTADSYCALGITQYELGDFNSALESEQRALGIRRKLFGEEHSSTADSYCALGITQRELGDFNSALESHQHALDIQRKLFGEKNSRTADSYRELGITQHELGDFNSALESHQRALRIRRKLFGEEHSSTADSYCELGIIQHELGDFNSALESQQRALDIHRKLFGEEHSSTACSYYLLGITQHKLGDFNSALESQQRVLDIQRKLFGEEHSSTADSYHLLGVTQHQLGDFN